MHRTYATAIAVCGCLLISAPAALAQDKMPGAAVQTGALLKLEKQLPRGKAGFARPARSRAELRNPRQDVLITGKSLAADAGNCLEPSPKGAGAAGIDRPLIPVADRSFEPAASLSKVQGWGRNHAVSNYPDDQQTPAIAKDSQGRLYVAYDWLYSGTGKHEIWLARSIDDGNNWEDLFYLGDNSFNYWRPSLAITPNDQCFLFYQTDDTLGMQYLASSGGNKWDFYYVPSWKSAYPKCHWPKIAAGLKNDSVRVTVTWMYDYYGNGSDYDIGYAYSRNSGGSWLAGWSRITGSGSQEKYPSICISDSLVAVAYELYGNWATNDSVDIMYSRTGGLSAPQDTAWSAGVSGIATNHHDRHPDLAASGRYLYLAGQRAYNDQNDYDILLKHANDGGKTLRAIDINESFEGTFPPADWTNGGCISSINNPRTGVRSLCFNTAGDYIITPRLVYPDSAVFWYRRSNNTNAWACSVAYSQSPSGPWTLMGVISNPTTSYQQYAYDFTGLANIYLRLKDARPAAGAEERYVDDFWVPAPPLVYVAGTGAEERYPALCAQDTTCFAGYFRDGSWAVCRRSYDQGNTWSEEEIASDSNSAQQGVSGIDVSLIGEYPRMTWTDNRNLSWGLGLDIYYNTDTRNFPRVCDLAPYKPQSWEFPLVPSKLKGTYTVSDTLRGFGTGARDTTYIDLCMIDSSSVDVADTFRAGLYVDEWLYAYLEDYRLPGWWTEAVADYPLQIFGGRHTMGITCDYDDRILYERTEDNNAFLRQWVWTPYRMPDDTTLQVPTPPVSVIDPAIPDYNCDGYWQASTNYWSAVAIKPAAGTDYDLRVYSDSYGKANAGFSVVAAESHLGPDTVEVVAVNGNKLTPGTRHYPGVYRSPKTGDGDYFAQFCLQDGTVPSNGWGTEKRMAEYHVVHTYDVNLNAGTLYYAACSLKAGPASLGFAVFSPKGQVYKSRSGAVKSFNDITAPGRQFSFVADTSGWHAFVVWHNGPAKDDTSRYFPGVSTNPFGLPLAVEMSSFTAAGFADSVLLRWRTESETNTLRWTVERADDRGGYSAIGALPAAGTSSMPVDYRFADRQVAPGRGYSYRLCQQDVDGTVEHYGPVNANTPGRPTGETGIGLRSAAPNPFDRSIAIEYQVAVQGQPVQLVVYNIAGQRVRTLLDSRPAPGLNRITWDGRDDGGGMATAGCYFLRWRVADRRGTEKITKVR